MGEWGIFFNMDVARWCSHRKELNNLRLSFLFLFYSFLNKDDEHARSFVSTEPFTSEDGVGHWPDDE